MVNRNTVRIPWYSCPRNRYPSQRHNNIIIKTIKLRLDIMVYERARVIINRLNVIVTSTLPPISLSVPAIVRLGSGTLINSGLKLQSVPIVLLLLL